MKTVISTLPTAPNRNNVSTFANDADAFLGALPTFGSELNSFGTELNLFPIKESCKVATTATRTLSGFTAIDGINLAVGDRILVKNQTTDNQNGIYVITDSNGTWARAEDANTAEKLAGAIVSVLFGTTNGGFQFFTTFKASDTLGTTSVTWLPKPELLISGKVGVNNLAIGNSSTLNNVLSTGNENIVIGATSGNSITSGDKNILIGATTGQSIITGNANIFIGTSLGIVSVGSSSNNIQIGDGLSYNATTGTEIIIGQGLTGKGNNSTFIGSSTVGHTIYNSGNTSTWNTTSDQRLKKNIQDNNTGLNIIKAIKVRNFEYKTEQEITELDLNNVINIQGTQLGVIAQEMPQEFVTENSTGVLSVNTNNLIWYLVNAIKELSQRIEQLEAK
jgi:hypothetical protein